MSHFYGTVKPSDEKQSKKKSQKQQQKMLQQQQQQNDDYPEYNQQPMKQTGAGVWTRPDPVDLTNPENIHEALVTVEIEHATKVFLEKNEVKWEMNEKAISALIPPTVFDWDGERKEVDRTKAHFHSVSVIDASSDFSTAVEVQANPRLGLESVFVNGNTGERSFLRIGPNASGAFAQEVELHNATSTSDPQVREWMHMPRDTFPEIDPVKNSSLGLVPIDSAYTSIFNKNNFNTSQFNRVGENYAVDKNIVDSLNKIINNTYSKMSFTDMTAFGFTVKPANGRFFVDPADSADFKAAHPRSAKLSFVLKIKYGFPRRAAPLGGN
jgi:hypothetical protein